MLVLAATLTPLGGPATNALQQGKDLRPRVLLSAGCSHSAEAAQMVSDFLNDLGVPAVLGGVDQRGDFTNDSEMLNLEKNPYYLADRDAGMNPAIDQLISATQAKGFAPVIKALHAPDPVIIDGMLNKYGGLTVLPLRGNALDTTVCQIRDCFGVEAVCQTKANPPYREEDRRTLPMCNDVVGQVINFTSGAPSNICFERRKLVSEEQSQLKVKMESGFVGAIRASTLDKLAAERLEVVRKATGNNATVVTTEDLMSFKYDAGASKSVSLDAWRKLMTALDPPLPVTETVLADRLKYVDSKQKPSPTGEQFANPDEARKIIMAADDVKWMWRWPESSPTATSPPKASRACGLLYFVHIPETGGTTVNKYLEELGDQGWEFERLYWGDEQKGWMAHPEKWKSSAGWTRLQENMERNWHPKMILEGHHGAPGLEYMLDNELKDTACELERRGCALKVATVLREPISRSVSSVVFNRGDVKNETQAIGDVTWENNAQARYLLHGHPLQWPDGWHKLALDGEVHELERRVQKVLARTSLVGTTERLADFMHAISDLLGVSKPADQLDVLNPSNDQSVETSKTLQDAMMQASLADRSIYTAWSSGGRPEHHEEPRCATLADQADDMPGVQRAQGGGDTAAQTVIPTQTKQDQMSDAAAMAYREQPMPPATVCSDSLQSGQRLMLTAFVAEGFHGSTALQQALMSAKNVGTLCNGDNWECEAEVSKRRCETCRAFDRPASALPCIACAATPHGVANGTEAFRSNLELFEPYWMAQPTKPVLVVKWVPIWPGSALWDVMATSDWVKPGGGVAPTPGFDLEEIETATVPRGMAASGVHRVSWGVIIMHRPWCMWSMSSHARNSRERDLKAWAVRELFATERLVAYHRKLAYDHVPALVTSYAQLLWRPDDFVMRVKRFAPCTGDVDLNFVPKLGVDISEANMLKIEGSIISYGKAVEPETFGVRADTRADTGACTAPAKELYAGLDEGQRKRAQLAEDYLRGLSVDDVVVARQP